MVRFPPIQPPQSWMSLKPVAVNIGTMLASFLLWENSRNIGSNLLSKKEENYPNNAPAAFVALSSVNTVPTNAHHSADSLYVVNDAALTLCSLQKSLSSLGFFLLSKTNARAVLLKLAIWEDPSIPTHLLPCLPLGRVVIDLILCLPLLPHLTR